MLKHGRYYWCRLPTCKKSLWTFWNKKYWGVSWFVCSKGYINVSWCIWELLKYVLKYMYNQLQKLLPRSLQKIWNYKQPLKTAPDQSMLRVRLWKLMQHWCNIDWKNKGWGATKLISIWIRVWQRYFVTDCLKKLEMYILSLRWYFESIEIGTAAYSRSCLFHKTIFLNWLTLYKRKVK